jgi:hypothetical protein
MIATLLANLSQHPWLVIAAEAVIAVIGVVGLIALFSPALFARLARGGATWFDTKPFFQRIDRPFYVDVPLMLHSRVFGLVVLACAAALSWATPSMAPWSTIVWSIVGTLAVIGTIAVICPKCFRSLAAWGNTWIDTSRMISVLDRRIDIDDFVLRHSRAFGIFVLASIAAMAALWYWR